MRHRTQRGFIGSPVLADLEGDQKPEIVAAAMDRHVYAWDGGWLRSVDGFPTLVVDRSKLAPAGSTRRPTRSRSAPTPATRSTRAPS